MPVFFPEFRFYKWRPELRLLQTARPKAFNVD